jgi:hypothetical protein
MVQDKELVLELIDLTLQLFYLDVLSICVVLFSNQLLLGGGEVDIESVVDLLHLLRAETVVVLQDVYSLSLLEELLS